MPPFAGIDINIGLLEFDEGFERNTEIQKKYWTRK